MVDKAMVLFLEEGDEAEDEDRVEGLHLIRQQQGVAPEAAVHLDALKVGWRDAAT